MRRVAEFMPLEAHLFQECWLFIVWSKYKCSGKISSSNMHRSTWHSSFADSKTETHVNRRKRLFRHI